VSTDDLILRIGGRVLSGWERIRVTRGIERMPNDFDASMTEVYPGELDTVTVAPGDSFTAQLGDDVVITGWLDRFMPAIDARTHSIQLAGRGRCQDLVDCSVIYPGSLIQSADVLELAQRVGAAYAIAARAEPGTPTGVRMPAIAVNLGETGWAIIERACRFAGLLAYEGAAGELILARAGAQRAASGAAEGANIKRASAMYSMDARYSEYIALRVGTDLLTDAGSGGNVITSVTDDGVNRLRRLVVVSEAGNYGDSVAIQRAVWEKNRRIGRSYSIHVTVDSWRDSSGALWEPNTLIPIHAPKCRVNNQEWLITEVTYRRSPETGTEADIVAMPAAAFAVAPIMLRFPADVEEALK
jgi:prophage tail gpP-like protein